MNLEKKLLKQREISTKNMPAEIVTSVSHILEDLEKGDIIKNALKEGDKIPEFTLKNLNGENINIFDFLEEKGPIILNFFRGSWCPYCNLELQGYSEIYENIKAVGGDLIAVSPGLSDDKFKIEENNKLPFEVLVDANNTVGKKLGIVFNLGEELVNKYKKVGIDLEKQGTKNGEMPIPVTYIIGKDGVILYSYINVDYHERLEPEKALDLLEEQINKQSV